MAQAQVGDYIQFNQAKSRVIEAYEVDGEWFMECEDGSCYGETDLTDDQVLLESEVIL